MACMGFFGKVFVDGPPWGSEVASLGNVIPGYRGEKLIALPLVHGTIPSQDHCGKEHEGPISWRNVKVPIRQNKMSNFEALMARLLSADASPFQTYKSNCFFWASAPMHNRSTRDEQTKVPSSGSAQLWQSWETSPDLQHYPARRLGVEEFNVFAWGTEMPRAIPAPCPHPFSL